MILSAGFGKRMGRLSEVCPKPCLPLLNEPLLKHTIRWLRSAGCKEVVINIHHLKDVFRQTLHEDLGDPSWLCVIEEPKILGTGGGVRNAMQMLYGSFIADDFTLVVINGDILFAPELHPMLKAHQQKDPMATMVLRHAPENSKYSSIISERDRVIEIEKVHSASTSTGSEDMFTGLSILSGRAIRDLPHEGCLVRQGIDRWISMDGGVAAYQAECPWFDMGSLEHYWNLNMALVDGSVGSEATQKGVHPSARIASHARVAHSVIGKNAVVDEGVELDHCVVWAGAHVTRSASHAVITPAFTLQVSTS